MENALTLGTWSPPQPADAITVVLSFHTTDNAEEAERWRSELSAGHTDLVFARDKPNRKPNTENPRSTTGNWRSAEGPAGIAVAGLITRGPHIQLLLPLLENGPQMRASSPNRVLEKAGFRREGHLRSYLVFERQRGDALVYSLLPSDLS
jgi:hypothetical protein